MILAATAWLLAAAPQPADVAGLYVSNQMEVAAALELQPGGHFRYQLDYGAVSEGAEGDWTFDGTTVRLTTNPAPKEPAFALVRDDAALAGQLFVAIDSPNFSWSPLNVELTLEGTDEPVLLSTQDEGRVPISVKRGWINDRRRSMSPAHKASRHSRSTESMRSQLLSFTARPA